MGGKFRPGGVTAIASWDFALGIFFVLAFILNLLSAPLNLAPFVVGILFVAFGLGIWNGMPWAWYVLTFTGGFFGWYYARNDVKEFFGIEDNHNDESEYSGD